MTDQYQTINGESSGEFKDRGSKFIATAFEVYTVEECQERLLEIRKLHPKARHHCYGYRLGAAGKDYRANDAGEPSGTAGRPILGQIDSFELTNVIVIVVRYFGGTKLGTSGLINAYKLSSREALQQAQTVRKIVEDIYLLEFEYRLMGEVMNFIKKEDLKVVQQDFEEQAAVRIALRKSKAADILDKLKAAAGQKHLEEIDPQTKIEGLCITYLTTR